MIELLVLGISTYLHIDIIRGLRAKTKKTNVNYIIMPNTSKFDSLHVAHFPKVSVFIFVRFLLLLYLAKSLKTNWSNVVCYFYFQTVGS